MLCCVSAQVVSELWDEQVSLGEREDTALERQGYSEQQNCQSCQRLFFRDQLLVVVPCTLLEEYPACHLARAPRVAAAGRWRVNESEAIRAERAGSWMD